MVPDIEHRSEKFYTELVLVTVLSLVAAGAWSRWLSRSLDYLFPGSLSIDLVTAIITTIAAILILRAVFPKDDY